MVAVKNKNGKRLLLTGITILAVCLSSNLLGQHPDHHAMHSRDSVSNVEAQPLLAQAIRLKDALTFLGSSLQDKDERQLIALKNQPLTSAVSAKCSAHSRSLLPGHDKYQS